MNQHDSGRFCTESIESAAKRYKTLGFSSIPLHGARNAQHPKLPAIKWARFQHTLASDEELQNWFHDQPAAGLGIVCGRVSRLLVVDFDDAAVASEFRHLYPDLVQTFTVRSGTRGLPHFYYRLPEGKLITTSAFPGVDLRGEGAYVVAAPTRVGKAEWTVECDLPVHAISEFELRRMIRFLAGLKATQAVQTVEVSDVLAKVQASEFRRLPSDDELVAYYHRYCSLGRNQALFKTAVMARDAGILESACCVSLAPVHAHEPGMENEDYRTRYSEAVKTIASAYKRPARRTPKASAAQLGNATREWLLSNRLSALARVLDGLYTVGVKPDECFTEFEVCQKLTRLKIGRRSIMAALKVTVGDSRVFEAVASPLYPPIDAHAAKWSEDLNNSCEMSRGAKRVKIVKRGRPAQLYRLPAPDKVAVMVGVKTTAGDEVSSVEFASPRTYRLALHRQLLERRPGHYARTWLANRLGVSRWTTRRYEKAANLYVQPAYTTQRLSWVTAATLPQTREDRSWGVFLESSDGRRYPAIRGLALKLLKKGCELLLKHQQANYYAATPASVGIPTPHAHLNTEIFNASGHGLIRNEIPPNGLSVGIPTPPPPLPAENGRSKIVERSPSVGIPTHPTGEPTFWLCPECLDFHVAVDRPDDCSRCGCKSDWEVIAQAIWRDTQALKQWWQSRYRDHQQAKRERALAAFEQPESVLTQEAKTLAEKVHTQIPNLSFANAQKVVRQFSSQLIENALLVVRGRAELRNPAGFLIVFLRSEHKLLYGNKCDPVCVAKAKGESAAEWVRQLMKSQYLSFLANANDIIDSNMGLSNELSPA